MLHEVKYPGIEKQITQKIVKFVSTSLHALGPAVQIGKQMILGPSSKSIDFYCSKTPFFNMPVFS